MRITACNQLARTKFFRLAQGKLFGHGPFANGRSMQNWEKSKRAVVIPPEGYSIVQRDQGGADARVVAYEVPLGNFRKLFINGIKPHCYVALRRYKKEFGARIPERAGQFLEAAETPIDKLKSLPYWKELVAIIADSDNWEDTARYYFNGKTMCHALNYKAGAKIYRDTLLKRSGGQTWISAAEAELDVRIYQEELFPEIFKIWHVRVLKEFAENGNTIYNLFGHPIRFTPRMRHSDKDVISAVPQSTVGEITHRAFYLTQEYIEENKRDWHLFNNCHDSFALIAPDDEAEEANNIMKSFIEMDLVSTIGEPFRMLSSGMIGKNWGPWHEKKNPQGLVEK